MGFLYIFFNVHISGGFHSHGGTPNSWMVYSCLFHGNSHLLDDNWRDPYRKHMETSQVAWEKLGLSRATRLERLRVAAEVGDARRLAALLEAGADVDAVNEPRLQCQILQILMSQVVVQRCPKVPRNSMQQF